MAETGLWRLPPPAPCRVCGPQARSTTAGGGSGDRHMPGGRRPPGPANEGVTEDAGKAIMRINEHLTLLDFFFLFGLVRIRPFRSDLTISEPWDEGDRFE